MALKFDDSSITVSGTKVITGPSEISNTISLSEWVNMLLNRTKTLPRLCRLPGL